MAKGGEQRAGSVGSKPLHSAVSSRAKTYTYFICIKHSLWKGACLLLPGTILSPKHGTLQ